MKLAHLLFISVLLSSCSTSENENEARELELKTYSDETNRAFEMIERGYRKPRATKKTPPIDPPQVVRDAPVRAPQNRAKSAAQNNSPLLKAPADQKNSEKLVELNQNLAFYCMKHRQDAVFKNDENKCMDHVNGILKQCQKQHSSHTKLLSCIKKKLNQK